MSLYVIGLFYQNIFKLNINLITILGLVLLCLTLRLNQIVKHNSVVKLYPIDFLIPWRIASFLNHFRWTCRQIIVPCYPRSIAHVASPLLTLFNFYPGMDT